MKNNKSKIVSIISTLTILLLITGFATAQNSVTKERIIPVQAGTVQLQNGKAMVELNQQIQSFLADRQSSPTYFVVFTTYVNNVSISLSEKNNNSFSITGNSSEAKADYVVFIKQTIAIDAPSDKASEVNVK